MGKARDLRPKSKQKIWANEIEERERKRGDDIHFDDGNAMRIAQAMAGLMREERESNGGRVSKQWRFGVERWRAMGSTEARSFERREGKEEERSMERRDCKIINK